jgi:isopenicillin N synthase-like dioxygenase
MRHNLLLKTLTTAAPRRSFATVNTSGIPVIDFNSPRRHEEIAQGFKKMGFVYLGGHPIRDDVVSRAFEKSAEFFDLPHETKVVTLLAHVYLTEWSCRVNSLGKTHGRIEVMSR